MKKDTPGTLVRAIAPSIFLTFLLLLTMVIPAKQASARSEALPRLPQVAVLDFSLLSSLQAQAHAINGRDATLAVLHAMRSSGCYAMTPQKIVDHQLARHRFKKSLDNEEVQRLGRSLGDDYIASGDIINIRFLENPHRARVTLSVRLTDVLTGELANGAIETGTSIPSVSGSSSDRAMLQDALRNAASRVVSTLKAYTLPTATILQVQTEKKQQKMVILNRGTNGQMEPGLDMVVIRGTTRVGSIRVAQVRSDNALAYITDQRIDFRPGDKARTVFRDNRCGIIEDD